MARKKIPAHPSRDRSRAKQSVLLRSAESLGRLIGSLQRQLEIATGRVAAPRPNGSSRRRAAAKNGSVQSGTTKARNRARHASSPSTSGARRSAKKR